MRHWEMLYERSPVGLDLMVLALALALHAPLSLLEMKAPPKGAKAKGRLVNIDFIEQQIQKRQEKPVALPPKLPDVKKIQESIAKKVEAVKAQVVPKPLAKPFIPPPAPKKLEFKLSQTPAKLDPGQVKRLEANPQLLQNKTNFQSKNVLGSGPAAAPGLHMNASGASLASGSRLQSLGAQGGTLKGKSGFAVAADALPSSIGGGDDIKLGGSQVIVVPVGQRARGDASILSPTAVVKDRGSLAAAGVTPSGGSAKSTGAGLTGLSTGGATLQAGGNRAAAAPSSVGLKSEKSFSQTPVEKHLSSETKALGSLPAVPSLPKRSVPAQRPMFLITGPLADRTVVSREIPTYPEWAQARGIEASVQLQFTVSPEGRVKDTILVLRTSGYPEMDTLASNALKKWRFAPLAPDRYQDQVGTITMNFSVR